PFRRRLRVIRALVVPGYLVVSVEVDLESVGIVTPDVLDGARRHDIPLTGHHRSAPGMPAVVAGWPTEQLFHLCLRHADANLRIVLHEQLPARLPARPGPDQQEDAHSQQAEFQGNPDAAPGFSLAVNRGGHGEPRTFRR